MISGKYDSNYRRKHSTKDPIALSLEQNAQRKKRKEKKKHREKSIQSHAYYT